MSPWSTPGRNIIEYIRHNGIHLSGTQGEHTVRLKALHLHEVQSLFKEPVDIAFICTKSYDIEVS